MTKEKTKKKKRLIFNPLFWIGIFFLLFIILFYIAIPIAVKKIASDYVKENYDRDLEIGSFSLNPFGFTVTIDDLVLKDPDGSTFVKWKRFYVDPEIIPMISNEIVIDKVALIGYEINVREFEDGKFNFSDFLETTSEDTVEKPVEEPSEPWVIRLNELKIVKMDISYDDKTMEPDFLIGLNDFNSSIENFTINTESLTEWNLNFNISNGGRVALDGSLTLEPLAITTTVKLENIELLPYMALAPDIDLNSITDIKLNSDLIASFSMTDSLPQVNIEGKLSIDDLTTKQNLATKGSISFTELKFDLDPMSVKTKLNIKNIPISAGNDFVPENMTLSIRDGLFHSSYDISVDQADSTFLVSAKGRTNISDLDVIETKSQTTLISFNDFAINDLSFDLEPLKVDISEIILDSLYSNVSISKDQRININDALGIEPLPEDSVVAEKPDEKENPDAPKPDVFIKQIRLVNNVVDYTDNSLPLPFSTKIEKLNTTIDSIDLKDKKRTEISVKGIIDETATADISGSLYLSDPNYDTDIKLALNKLNLIHYSPYSAKFVGLLIDKGSFSMDVFYKVKNSQLDMKSKVRLNKLTFGKDYPSNDATSLPVKLPLTLLKDSKGNIEHDINATGDLSDPNVSIGGIIFKSVSQILLNVTKAPFKLLGAGLSMFTPDDLEHIDFAFGSAVLDSMQIKKIDGLSKPLLEKPSLKISVTGVADRRLDKKIILDNIYNSLITKNTKTPYDSLNTAGKQSLLEKTYRSIAVKPALIDSIKKANIVKLQPAPTPEMHSHLDTLKYLKDIKKNIFALQNIEDKDLIKLSNDRASAILKQFTVLDSIPVDQIEIVEGELTEEKGIKKIECKLELGVK